jgi:hypothetical protein
MLSDESLSSQEGTTPIPCEEFGYIQLGVEDIEITKRCYNATAIKPSMVERSLLPRMYSGALPHQSDCTGWLKYLPGLVIFKTGIVLVSTELTTRMLLTVHGTTPVDNFVGGVLNDSWATKAAIVLTLLTIGSMVVNDVLTLVFLLHGKRRRSLPENERLVHAVIVTQYKEVRYHVDSIWACHWECHHRIQTHGQLFRIIPLSSLSISRRRYWMPQSTP